VNQDTSLLRMASQWLLAAILAVALAVFFLAVVAVQLTSRGTGERILRRAVAVTTEIDATLPAIESGLHRAAQAGTDNRVRVPDFPIPVELPRDEALQLQGEALKARLLNEAASRLYEDGMSAWAAADPQAKQDIEPISTVGALRRGLGIITEDHHTFIVIAAVLLGLLSLALAAMLLLALRSYARLIALGTVTLTVALPSLAAAIAVRFGFRTAEAETDPFVTGLLKIGVDSMWVPLRFYLAMSTLAFATIAVVALIVWWQARAGGQPPALDTSA